MLSFKTIARVFRENSLYTMEELFLVTVSLGFLSYLSSINYLLFHSIVELFCIIVAFSTFIIYYNGYKINKNHCFIILGIAYGYIVLFDLLHTLSYKGMGVFPDYTADLPTQLWIIGRYMESISFLLWAVFLDKKFHYNKVFTAYGVISIFLLFALFRWNVFPSCYVDGQGLTLFKKTSEYIICGILILSIVFLMKNKNKLPKRIAYLIIPSLLATIISELFFTLYIGVFDLSTMLGHLFKLLSYYLIYKAVIETDFHMPYTKLLKSENRYKMLTRLSPVGIFIDHNNKLAFVNPAFSKMLGADKPEELIGKASLDFFHPDYHDTIKHRIAQIKQGQLAEPIERKLIGIDGQIIDVEVSAVSFPNESNDAILVIVRDIGSQKQAEQLAKRVEEESYKAQIAMEYDQLKTEFFSNISHELKTPINIILGTIQLLNQISDMQRTKHTPIHIDKYLGVMKQNCYRLLRLVNNLLDLTRLDAGFLKMNMKNYNIVSIVEDIALSVVEFTNSKEVTLIFDTDIEEKIIACDADKIERVILNLLSNAIKFTKPEDFIWVNIYDKSESVIISIKDTGIGIPDEMQKRIFERFRQVESLATRKHEGTGIGLSLVKSIIEAHEGNISLISEIGKGSEFVIELPAITIQEEAAAAFDKESYNSQTNIERIQIEFSDIYS
ncbi:MAG: MASE3 domain-containing sensor histidine kinase [Bacillota bacterium]